MPDTTMDAYDIIRTLPRRQQEVLGCVAIHDDGGHHPATLKALLAKGLIEAYQEDLGGRLSVPITRYRTPIFVHFAYCIWASAQGAKDATMQRNLDRAVPPRREEPEDARHPPRPRRTRRRTTR
jgi:hypothetical protein